LSCNRPSPPLFTPTSPSVATSELVRATEGDVEEWKERLGGGGGFLGCSDFAFGCSYDECSISGHGALDDGSGYWPKFVVLHSCGYPADLTIAQQHRIAMRWETVVAAVDM